MGRIRARAVRGPRSDGAWYWQARATRDNRTETVWVGWATRQDALRFLQTQGATLLDAQDWSSPPEISTISDLLRAWMAWQEDREEAGEIKPRTLSSYTGSVRRIIRATGSTLLDQLSHNVLARARVVALRRYAPKTVAQDLNVLRATLKWGAQLGLLDNPPEVPSVPAHKAREYRRCHRTPTPGEVEATLAEVRHPWLVLAVRIMWATGARLGEIGSLRARDWDQTAGTLVLRGKTGVRVVPVPEHLAATLDAWIPGEHTLLGVTDGTLRSAGSVALGEACAAAGIPQWTPHGLRRLAVDTYARAGIDVATAASLLGHSPEVMLRAYRGVSDEDRRRAVESARLGLGPRGEVIKLVHRTGTADEN